MDDLLLPSWSSCSTVQRARNRSRRLHPSQKILSVNARPIPPIEGQARCGRGAPRLPWISPLDQVGASRYERQSLLVPKAAFGAFCKLGARRGLFKNTTLMVALVLEVLVALAR